MKILTKHGFKFAVGMFWQIPDYGKKSVNLKKIIKDTGHDMYCQIASLGQTYGFCTKNFLPREKNVAALGKFIVEASKLTAEYTTSIVCYKFKKIGEIDDDGKTLKEDLFGYLILINGTICPIDGEYVGKFELVKNSVIEQAKLHPIDTLYLPIDVAENFLTIFERLDYAYHTDNNGELLLSIINSTHKDQLEKLLLFIKENFVPELIPSNLVNYLMKKSKSLINGKYNDEACVAELRKIIASEAFRANIKDNIQVENNIRYLVANILQVPFSSDDIFWNDKLKQNHNKSKLHSIISQRLKIYKWSSIILIVSLISYGIHSYLVGNTLPLQMAKSIKKVEPAKAIPLAPNQLIDLCLGNGNDKYFKDIGSWTLTGMKCDSLGSSYIFVSDVETTLSSFTKLVGTTMGVKFQNKNGIYSRSFHIIPSVQISKLLNKEEIVNKLEQHSITYSYKLTLIPANINNKSSLKGIRQNKFEIIAKVSPIFLLQHGVLASVKLNNIEMRFDKNSGVYTWTIEGVY